MRREPLIVIWQDKVIAKIYRKRLKVWFLD
jgi:hypothetical protein